MKILKQSVRFYTSYKIDYNLDCQGLVYELYILITPLHNSIWFIL
jgi:hypothetical protein